MTITYTISNELVLWHLIDEDGDCLLTGLDYPEFAENCELLFDVVL